MLVVSDWRWKGEMVLLFLTFFQMSSHTWWLFSRWRNITRSLVSCIWMKYCRSSKCHVLIKPNWKRPGDSSLFATWLIRLFCFDVSKFSFICYIIRKKLRHLLQASNLYRVQLILGKIKQTELYSECAILYSKVRSSPLSWKLSTLYSFAIFDTFVCVPFSTIYHLLSSSIM